jgi:hypothetical protein
MKTKYGFNISKEVINKNSTRLKNQIWKLLPMKENNEDWEKQLNSVIEEIAGLNEIFSNEVNFLILLSKLEGLKSDIDFMLFRKDIFESISLLGELMDE